MSDFRDLAGFLAKLTVLCREHGIVLRNAGPVHSMREHEKTYVYKLLRSPFCPEDEWDLLTVSSAEMAEHQRKTLDCSEICVADQQYIRMMESGLD